MALQARRSHHQQVTTGPSVAADQTACPTYHCSLHSADGRLLGNPRSTAVLLLSGKHRMLRPLPSAVKLVCTMLSEQTSLTGCPGVHCSH